MIKLERDYPDWAAIERYLHDRGISCDNKQNVCSYDKDVKAMLKVANGITIDVFLRWNPNGIGARIYVGLLFESEHEEMLFRLKYL